jgi:hypothetical protein
MAWMRPVSGSCQERQETEIDKKRGGERIAFINISRISMVQLHIDSYYVASIIKISLASAPRESVALSKIENQLVKQINDCFF